jgi:ribonuclease HI
MIDLDPNIIYVFSDGGYRHTQGLGAYAYTLHHKGNLKEEYSARTETTSNREELTAVIKALSTLKLHSVSVIVQTDSQYVKNGITEWIKKWKGNGWKTADKHDVKNKDLWIELDRLVCLFRDIRFVWGKGHSGNEYNERVDFLCNQAMDLYIEKENIK